MKILKLNSNQVIAIILLIFSIFYLYQAYQIPNFMIPRPIDSDLFPKVLGLVMIVLAIFLFFTKYKEEAPALVDEETKETLEKIEKEMEKDNDVDTSSLPLWRQPKVQVVITMISILIYIFIFEKAGFVLTTLLYTFAMTFYFGYKKHVINLLVSAFISMGFYFLLTKGLGVYLPKGILPM